MLKGTNKVVESKDICNHVPLIEVFMQNWFMKEETTKQVPPSSSKGASGCTKKKSITHVLYSLIMTSNK